MRVRGRRGEKPGGGVGEEREKRVLRKEACALQQNFLKTQNEA